MKAFLSDRVRHMAHSIEFSEIVRKAVQCVGWMVLGRRGKGKMRCENVEGLECLGDEEGSCLHIDEAMSVYLQICVCILYQIHAPVQ